MQRSSTSSVICGGTRPCAGRRQRGGTRVRASTTAAEHIRYVCEVAVVPGKPKVDTLLRVRGWPANAPWLPWHGRLPKLDASALPALACPQVLEAQGHTVVSPADRQGLHPLLIPLAQRHQQQQSGSGSSDGGGGGLTCLLRWPEGHTGMELPVVQQARGGTQVRRSGGAAVRGATGPQAACAPALHMAAPLHLLLCADPACGCLLPPAAPQVRLLARSLDEYLHRALAEEESGGSGGGAVAQAAGSDGAALYAPGALEGSAMPSLDAYLTRKVRLVAVAAVCLGGAEEQAAEPLGGVPRCPGAAPQPASAPRLRCRAVAALRCPATALAPAPRMSLPRCCCCSRSSCCAGCGACGAGGNVPGCG